MEDLHGLEDSDVDDTNQVLQEQSPNVFEHKLKVFERGDKAVTVSSTKNKDDSEDDFGEDDLLPKGNDSQRYAVTSKSVCARAGRIWCVEIAMNKTGTRQ